MRSRIRLRLIRGELTVSHDPVYEGYEVRRLRCDDCDQYVNVRHGEGRLVWKHGCGKLMKEVGWWRSS